MQAIDLTDKLKGYHTGWVALDQRYNVVAHADSFKSISEKIKKRKDKFILMPATDNYFGYVGANG